MIFLDTSAALALADTEDDFHFQAVIAMEGILERRETLFTHNYVLIESAALMQRRLGMSSAMSFLSDAPKLAATHWINENDHFEAVDLWQRRGLRKLSLVDCMSFVLMQRFEITQAFAYDSDFATQGFELIG